MVSRRIDGLPIPAHLASNPSEIAFKAASVGKQTGDHRLLDAVLLNAPPSPSPPLSPNNRAWKSNRPRAAE